jgi:8-oxo-dGTP pyrophosphatase MutT (NUDIX family)
MYKVYINDTPVFLMHPQDAVSIPSGKTIYKAAYTGKKKMVRQYLDMLQKNRAVEKVVIYSDDLQSLWDDFQSCFTILEAAGGYVLNSREELLVFFRRGSWDMPKGKIDPGETPQEAAVREVQEETGLQVVRLGAFLCHTYHTYELKGKHILKKTWWYTMQTEEEKVVPQTEEDIEAIEWVRPQTWLEQSPPLYGSIRDVIILANNNFSH